MFRRGLGAARMLARATSTAASGLGPPFPPSEYQVHLPQDQYRHVEAPTEWWWHVGTLKAGERIFGFEINAAGYPGYSPDLKFAFTQVMLSDVANAKHYQQTTVYRPPNVDFDTWAESDPTKNWYARLGDSNQPSYVSMRAPQADPTRDMAVTPSMVDTATGTAIDFNLMLSQQGAPFMVFGTGARVDPDNPQHKNYYYSLTRLKAAGTISIDGEPMGVTGMTWMDHEYGYFGSPGDPVKWILQNAQLDNGWHVMNFVSLGKDNPPALGTRTPSNATLQDPQGNMYYLDADSQQAFMTPTGRTWKSPTGNTYFLEYLVEILPVQAKLTVVSLMDDQEFPNVSEPGGIYEGVAVASGTFQGQQVSGTAWNEQLLR